MSLTATLTPHLPYLRRFARALTGSQASGDAYAMAALEAIAGGVAIPTDSKGARRALYAVFLKIWSSVPINQMDEAPEQSGAVAAADRNLKALTPPARVAFLLRTVEGFGTDDIAEILGIPESGVAALLEQAGREIAQQLSTDVLIIEDEAIIAMDLEALVTDLGHRVTRIARTRREAIAAVQDSTPGLVLADIHLADGSSGLDAVNDILQQFSVPVVFITAYPERLLTGDRPEPAFLITKPFRPETVMAIVSQALFFDRRAMANAA